MALNKKENEWLKCECELCAGHMYIYTYDCVCTQSESSATGLNIQYVYIIYILCDCCCARFTDFHIALDFLFGSCAHFYAVVVSSVFILLGEYVRWFVFFFVLLV